MNITTKNYQNLFLATSLLLSLCCGAFLFDSTDNLLKKLLILFFVASLLSNRPTLCNLSSFKDFIAPWLPWCLLFVGVGYISHGSKGLAYFFQLCILLTLFGITFSKVYFSRLVVVRGLALNIIFISVPIVLYVLIYGVKTEFLGNNKNILIAGLTLMSVIVVTYFLQMRKSCSSFDKFLITVACACSSVAIVLSEVRLAMLGIFGALFVLLIWSKKIFSFKALGLFALVMLFFCLGFMATGRLQQGYHDLIMWENGNSYSSWGIRIELWKLAINASREHFLFGWGFKPYNLLLESGYFTSISNYCAQHFHNDFLNSLVSYGLVGTIGWLLTICGLFSQTRKDPLRLVLISSMVSMGLVDCFWTFSHFVLFLFVILWGLLYFSDPSRIKYTHISLHRHISKGVTPSMQ